MSCPSSPVGCCTASDKTLTAAVTVPRKLKGHEVGTGHENNKEERRPAPHPPESSAAPDPWTPRHAPGEQRLTLYCQCRSGHPSFVFESLRSDGMDHSLGQAAAKAEDYHRCRWPPTTRHENSKLFSACATYSYHNSQLSPGIVRVPGSTVASRATSETTTCDTNATDNGNMVLLA